VRRQHIVAVPNDRFTRDQCLNNATFCAAVDPIMVSGAFVCFEIGLLLSIDRRAHPPSLLPAWSMRIDLDPFLNYASLPHHTTPT
jgi:hypothetical protein